MRLSRKRLRVFLAVLMVLAVLAAGVFAAPRVMEWLWPVDHAVAEAVVPDHGVPEMVSEAAWEWRPPEEEVIDGVLPVPNGAVVVSGSGVVGLDGATGEVLWEVGGGAPLLRLRGGVVRTTLRTLVGDGSSVFRRAG